MNSICPNGGKYCVDAYGGSEGYQGLPSGMRGIDTKMLMAPVIQSNVASGILSSQLIIPLILVGIVVIPFLLSR